MKLEVAQEIYHCFRVLYSTVKALNDQLYSSEFTHSEVLSY